MTGAVVLATNQGLGILAKSFYDHGVVNKVLIKPHSVRQNHPEWYGANGRPLHQSNYDWFFRGLDSIIYFEDPFDWKMIPRVRDLGIKNVFMPMYECTRNPMPYEPDLIICPSLLDLKYFKNKNAIFMQVPVEQRSRLRQEARVFVHNAGNGGLGGRNGTRELIEAMRYVKSPIKLIIRTQSLDLQCNDPRVEIRRGNFPYETLYDEGDVFIFPEKFNGLSLPLQEAYAAGMLVMATKRYPMTTWLPHRPLINPRGFRRERIAVEFESAIVDPRDIAAKIDEWYGKDISAFSELGIEWAQLNSWKVLKPKYLALCAK